MKVLITALLLTFLVGCTSTDLLETAQIASIASTAKDKIEASKQAVLSEKEVYSDSDYNSLVFNYDKLISIYGDLSDIGKEESRNRAIAKTLARLPEVKAVVERVYDTLKANLENHSDTNRAVIDDLLFDLEVLEQVYQAKTATKNRQEIINAGMTYLRALSPLLLQLARS